MNGTWLLKQEKWPNWIVLAIVHEVQTRVCVEEGLQKEICIFRDCLTFVWEFCILVFASSF